MRIALYGMPGAGKTYILEKIDFIQVMSGSRLLRRYVPDFDRRNEIGRREARKSLADLLAARSGFIMDGHYAFGNEVAFTEADGKLYDIILYLYCSPAVLMERMAVSPKNKKYLCYNIADWQNREIDALRKYCHMYDKDFYVLDTPPDDQFVDTVSVVRFIKEIINGYSCVSFARKCTNKILSKSRSDIIRLFDGDKTLTIEDSSNRVFGYQTHLFDGNFYTGYQTWKQKREFEKYLFCDITEMPVHLNEKVITDLVGDSFILTSGHEKVWKFISEQLGVDCFYGEQMSAETKFFITKFLQNSGKYVVGYGDGMGDYFMLRQANKGYLVTRNNGSVSKSLGTKDLGGLVLV